MEDQEAKKKNIETLVRWGIGLVAVAILSPVIFLALKGVLGLMALAVAGGVGYIGIQMAPVFAMKVANQKMKEIVAEAEKNPIETMQNLYVEKSKELSEADQRITEFNTEVLNFDDQVGTFKKEYPDEAPAYVEISGRMHDGLTDMRAQQRIARDQLKNFAMQIDKAKAIYKMALAAARVTRFSQSAEDKVFADIKEKVAFDSVRSQLNHAFASMNTALEKRETVRQIAPPSPTISSSKMIDGDKAKIERVG